MHELQDAGYLSCPTHRTRFKTVEFELDHHTERMVMRCDDCGKAPYVWPDQEKARDANKFGCTTPTARVNNAVAFAIGAAANAGWETYSTFSQALENKPLDEDHGFAGVRAAAFKKVY
jgi:hypothetical protein